MNGYVGAPGGKIEVERLGHAPRKSLLTLLGIDPFEDRRVRLVAAGLQALEQLDRCVSERGEQAGRLLRRGSRLELVHQRVVGLAFVTDVLRHPLL